VPYTQSFASRGPDDLLRFAREEAPEALGTDGNSWLRLMDIAVAGARRAAATADRQAYAAAALIAVDGLRRYTPMRKLDWASLAVRARVSCLLACDPPEEQKKAEAAEIYAIFADQVRDPDLERAKVSGMAIRLSRIAEYLTMEQQATVGRWAQ
jgi:hypothetical protein